jgi:hypothetical protein
LDDLRKRLKQIDDETGSTFTAMNDWYKISRVEETDLIAPSTTNALVRISIILQRGYTTGVAFDFSVFTQLFTKTSSATLP